MNNAAWYSQPFPPEGASAAEGIRNQLGRPEMDLLTILIRESAQNSWDARLPDHTVDFRVDFHTVNAARAPIWRDALLREAPLTERLPLRASLSAPTINVLAISDRGTSGLGGPTRADSAVAQNHDFVSFVRNIGEPRDTTLGGGTYGFGKGIFYLIAKSGAVLVHTRCRVEDGFETRLIGCALWQSYVGGTGVNATRYTGRHWWGRHTGEVIEPLTGAEADSMARDLGLRAFEPDETGTTIVVIDPELGGRTSEEALGYLADTVLWNLWPKMLSSGDDHPPMRFSVWHQGSEVAVPDPRTTRPIDMFVEAYENMCSDEKVHVLKSFRPKGILGRLGMEKRFVMPLEPSEAASVMGVEATIHHVCLMRTAELVVSYHEGPKPPAEHVSYAGVFRADEAMDATFAASEPPTHDAWTWQSLEGPQKSFVRVTFRRLKEQLDALVDIDDKIRTPGAEVPLGAASRAFSNLVTGSWGIGGGIHFGTARPSPVPTPSQTDESWGEAGYEDETTEIRQPKSQPSPARDEAFWNGRQQGGEQTADGDRPASNGHHITTASEQAGWRPPNTPPAQQPARRPKVEYVDEPYYDSRGEQVVLVQAFRLPVPGVQQVSPQLSILLPGNGVRETDPPMNAPRPEFFGWEDDNGLLNRARNLVVSGGVGVWRLLVVPAPDTVTDIGVAVARAEALR